MKYIIFYLIYNIPINEWKHTVINSTYLIITNNVFLVILTLVFNRYNFNSFEVRKHGFR